MPTHGTDRNLSLDLSMFQSYSWFVFGLSSDTTLVKLSAPKQFDIIMGYG